MYYNFIIKKIFLSFFFSIKIFDNMKICGKEKMKIVSKEVIANIYRHFTVDIPSANGSEVSPIREKRTKKPYNVLVLLN